LEEFWLFGRYVEDVNEVELKYEMKNLLSHHRPPLRLIICSLKAPYDIAFRIGKINALQLHVSDEIAGRKK
jgi:hypothetical protein